MTEAEYKRHNRQISRSNQVDDVVALDSTQNETVSNNMAAAHEDIFVSTLTDGRIPFLSTSPSVSHPSPSSVDGVTDNLAKLNLENVSREERKKNTNKSSIRDKKILDNAKVAISRCVDSLSRSYDGLKAAQVVISECRTALINVRPSAKALVDLKCEVDDSLNKLEARWQVLSELLLNDHPLEYSSGM